MEESKVGYEKITKYKTTDGKLFDSPKEAKEHLLEEKGNVKEWGKFI